MNELKSFCKTHGIRLFELPRESKFRVLYWHDIKKLLVFSNATERDIAALIDGLTKQYCPVEGIAA